MKQARRGGSNVNRVVYGSKEGGILCGSNVSRVVYGSKLGGVGAM